MQPRACAVRTARVLAISILGLASALPAQEPAGHTYPAELIDALFGIEEGEIVVGALPDSDSEDFPLLPGLRIIGSRKSDKLVSVIAEASQPFGEVEQQYHELLAEQGWERREQRGASHGFVPSGGRSYHWYCNDEDVFFKPTIESETATGRTRVWLYRSLGDNQRCQDEPANDSSQPSSGDAPFPRIAVPADSKMKITGGRYQEYSIQNSAAITGDVPARALASVFADQIAAQGWRSKGRCRQGPVYFETFTMQDDNEQTWVGMLTVFDAGSEAGTHASFEVMRDDAAAL